MKYLTNSLFFITLILALPLIYIIYYVQLAIIMAGALHAIVREYLE